MTYPLSLATTPEYVRETSAPYVVERDASARHRALTDALERETAIDRRLALGLARVWDDDSYRPLGHSRAIDFAREALGLREGKARWLCRLGRALRDVPELDRALARGALTASKVVELARGVDGTMPEHQRHAWIEHARTSTLTSLRRAVSAELARRGDGAIDEPESDTLAIAAPAHVAELWHHAKEAARKQDGRQLSSLACAEWIAADYLARVGDEDPAVAQRVEDEHRHEQRIESAVRLLERHQRACTPSPAVAPDERTEPRLSIVRVDAQPEEDPRQLAQLIEQQRRMRLEIGERLEDIRRHGDWQMLGYGTFARYCRERLVLPERSAQASIWFYRQLRIYKRLRRAYLRGTLSYSATAELLHVVHRRTEERWLRWAIGLTCREIARVVDRVAPYAGPAGDALARAEELLRPGAQTFARRGRIGPPLPPTSARGKPQVPGLADAMLNAPEALVAHIRLSGPSDAVAVVRRAIRRCRALHDGSRQPDWWFLQIILVEFLRESDSAEARRFLRRHPILARDDFWCQIPSCTSRTNLHAHHVWMRSEGGPDDSWNQVTLCVAHHRMVHLGIIAMGGWAPWALSIRMGLDDDGRAHVSYQNGRLASDDEVRARLQKWRTWRRRTAPRAPRPSRVPSAT